MMADTQINDGGPAMPTPFIAVAASGEGDCNLSVPHQDDWPKGMSLRDWFAGQALAGVLASGEGDDSTIGEVVSDCMRYADAMLAARLEY